MHLHEYIQAKRGNGVYLAAKLCIPQTYLTQMAKGIRAISPDRAVAIEYHTDGMVCVEETLPGQRWRRERDRAWPHPKGRPLADVGADHLANMQAEPMPEPAPAAEGV